MTEAGSEASTRDDLQSQDPEQMVASIRDLAVMLCMAGEYLCEARVLSNLGAAIEKDVERLKAGVDVLRGQFVGRPPQNMDMDVQMEGLYAVSERLKSPEVSAQGQSGLEDLGRELKEKLQAFGMALEAFKQKLYGEPVAYTSADYVSNQWDRLRAGFRKAAAIGRRLLRVCVTLLACAGVFFLVLFLTMEKDDVFLKEIDNAKAQIQLRQAALAKTEAQLSEIRRELALVRSDELSREETVRVLELRTKARELREEKDRIQMEARGYEKALEQAQQQLDALRRKTLIERLLRR